MKVRKHEVNTSPTHPHQPCVSLAQDRHLYLSKDVRGELERTSTQGAREFLLCKISLDVTVWGANAVAQIQYMHVEPVRKIMQLC